jgi:hypothetical protein
MVKYGYVAMFSFMHGKNPKAFPHHPRQRVALHQLLLLPFLLIIILIPLWRQFLRIPGFPGYPLL